MTTTTTTPAPDVGIKNAKVLKEDVPGVSSTNPNALGYFVRYRIVSNDKNRSSHWSPYHFLLTGELQTVECSVTTSGTSPKVINMVWQHPKISQDSNEISVFKEYDIYIKTNLRDWYFLASSSSTQFSSLVPSGASSIQVAVQVPVYPKIYNVDAAIFTLATPLVV
jgi:hypothetical protein